MKALDEQLLKAAKALNDSESTMTTLFAKSEHLELFSDSVQENVRSLQLLLQYRLDTQDALVRLMQVEGRLLQILGIEFQSNAGINIERLAYAIGVEDLHQILFALSRLVETLLHVAHLYQKNSKKRKENLAQKSLQEKFRKDIGRAIKQQKIAINAITALGSNLEHLQKREAIGPVLNHISALRGPVSRFYQALQNGLMQSHGLYEKLNKTVGFDKNLASVLESVDDLVKQLSHRKNPQFFNAVEHSEEEKLEQRASKRRFGQFFGH